MLVNSSFSSAWSELLIISILQPGGKAYRSISLASTMNKLFERMVANRLEMWMKKTCYIRGTQYDFRKGKSIIDCVAYLITGILVSEMKELRVPGRLCNFTAFVISSRKLLFSHRRHGIS